MATEGADLLAQLEECGALQRGHFALSSGLHSDGYVQCALFLQRPERARAAAAALAARLRRHRPDSVLSPALGGLIVGHEVAEALAVPFRFAERQGEAMTLRRGFSLRAGERVAIVEDVVTTGRSSAEVAALATGLGARVVALAALVDRSAGAGAGVLPFESLARLDLATHAAAGCPLCRRGEPLLKPGSRPQPA